MTTLNPYQITWSILIPVSGKATKKDLSIIAKSGIYSISSNLNNEFFFHSADKEKAIEKAKNIKGLSKKYEVVMITDKQFGNVDVFKSFRLSATKKQLQERFFI